MAEFYYKVSIEKGHGRSGAHVEEVHYVKVENANQILKLLGDNADFITAIKPINRKAYETANNKE